MSRLHEALGHMDPKQLAASVPDRGQGKTGDCMQMSEYYVLLHEEYPALNGLRSHLQQLLHGRLYTEGARQLMMNGANWVLMTLIQTAQLEKLEDDYRAGFSDDQTVLFEVETGVIIDAPEPPAADGYGPSGV